MESEWKNRIQQAADNIVLPEEVKQKALKAVSRKAFHSGRGKRVVALATAAVIVLCAGVFAATRGIGVFDNGFGLDKYQRDRQEEAQKKAEPLLAQDQGSVDNEQVTVELAEVFYDGLNLIMAAHITAKEKETFLTEAYYGGQEFYIQKDSGEEKPLMTVMDAYKEGGYTRILGVDADVFIAEEESFSEMAAPVVGSLGIYWLEDGSMVLQCDSRFQTYLPSRKVSFNLELFPISGFEEFENLDRKNVEKLELPVALTLSEGLVLQKN